MKYDDKLLFIMDRACGVFAKKGFHQSSVRDVAAATGTSPAGLYYYFESKEELLHLILGDCLSSLLDRIEAEAVGITDPAGRLRAIVRTHLDHFKNKKREMRVLSHEWQALSGTFGAEIRELMRAYVRIVSDTLEEISPGRTREEIRVSTFGLLGMLSWVDQWYRTDQDIPLNLVAEQFSSIFLGGFSVEGSGSGQASDSPDDQPTQEWKKKNSASSILSGPGF
ncbi:MAG: TetR/AcrR family transcriptional regulator [Gemmatimonadetes bacterium]|nr:TetR/AcrR family transcriptional regulator [Gemmatimonadota bacterium]